MTTRFERNSARVTAVLAIALWVVGIVFDTAMPSTIPHHPTDAQLLVWLHRNHNWTIAGGWLFMTGCMMFLWFAGLVRARLAAAEGEVHTFSTIAFAGAIAAAVFGMGTQVEIGGAINSSELSAATAGAFHHLGDAFFLGAEMSMIVFLAGVTVVGVRQAVLPRLWVYFGALVAVVLWIGPIGWAALIFGMPIWMLGTSWLLYSPRRERRAAVPATATT
jgi:hypothetical protein